MGFYKIGYIIGISRVSWENENYSQKHYVILWDFVRGNEYKWSWERKKERKTEIKKKNKDDKKTKRGRKKRKRKKGNDVQIFSHNKYIIVIKIETVI